MADKLPPVYFSVVFWGVEFRECFLNFLLASLLSPNNIPALHNKRDAKFIIVTSKRDWQAIQDAPIFKLLSSYITPEWIHLPSLDNISEHDTKVKKMFYMSEGHKACTEAIFKAGAIGVYPTPDLIFADGAVANLQSYALQGKSVVLALAIRFEYHGCVSALQALGVLNTGKPLTIANRELVRVGVNNFHSETKRFVWDTNYMAEEPVACLWPLTADKQNYIVHSYSLAPVMVNYSEISKHDRSTFNNWTMDGDYIYKNFSDKQNIKLVTDSDDLFLLSLTKEEVLHIPQRVDLLQSLPWVGNIAKRCYLNNLHHSNRIDPLKRKLILQGIFMHVDDLNDTMLEEAQTCLALIQHSIKPIAVYKLKLLMKIKLYLWRIGHYSNPKNLVNKLLYRLGVVN